MDHGLTAYDEVHYPSALYRTTMHEHLAAIARLHGLEAADPRRARVLEIAGGDGLNLLAMAAAFPDADFVSFDLAPSAVAEGQALRAASGLGNVRVEVGDVVAAAEAPDGPLAGPFDYVIAHGLYAWVPPVVQQATLRLIDRVLAPTGIAYISYNAMPGGHLRRAVREMVLYEIEGITDPASRIATAKAFLADFGRARDDDSASQMALRRTARLAAEKDPHTLFHDELGPVFDPKWLDEIAAEAAAHNLAYLNEAQPGGFYHGFPGEAVDDAECVRRARRHDIEEVCFFHQSLFVRSGRQPLRVPDKALLATLLAGVPESLQRTGETEFAVGAGSFEVGDARLADFLGSLVEHAPARLPLARLAESADHAEAILRLIDRGIIEPHVLPYPGALTGGERPLVSALVRAMIARGMTALVGLDHRAVLVKDELPRALLAAMDGTRTRAELAEHAATLGLPAHIGIDHILQRFVRAGLLALPPAP